jgi:hypothetical protein
MDCSRHHSTSTYDYSMGAVQVLVQDLLATFLAHPCVPTVLGRIDQRHGRANVARSKSWRNAATLPILTELTLTLALALVLVLVFVLIPILVLVYTLIVGHVQCICTDSCTDSCTLVLVPDRLGGASSLSNIVSVIRLCLSRDFVCNRFVWCRVVSCRAVSCQVVYSYSFCTSSVMLMSSGRVGSGRAAHEFVVTQYRM